MEPKFIDILGQRMGYRESDGQGPELFFVHGNSQSGETFFNQLEGPLGRRFHLFAMDLSGHGASGSPMDVASQCSFPGHREAIVQMAQALLSGPTLFVGHSLGGHLLIESSPRLEHMAGLLVFGTPPLALPPRLDLAFCADGAVTTRIFSGSLHPDEIKDWASRQFWKQNSDAITLVERMISETHPMARPALGKSAEKGDFVDEMKILEFLSVPLAILHGEHDALINGDYFKGLSFPTLWNDAVTILRDVGHCPHLEDPEAFDGIILQFARHCGLFTP